MTIVKNGVKIVSGFELSQLKNETRQMLGANYKTKKALKESVGQRLDYVETSYFGLEYKSNGVLTVVGPSPYERKWFAAVTIENDKIAKVK